MPQKLEIIIEPEAITDIQDAVNYYKQIRLSLGKKFFANIEHHLKLLSKHPKAFAIRYDEIRCLPLKKFPYMIHYGVEENDQRIIIKAVFCVHQDPADWEKRI